jgi:hypothetical protein
MLALVFFNMAYMNWVSFRKLRSDMLIKLNSKPVVEANVNDLYRWFGMSFTCVWCLWTSLETVANTYFEPTTEYRRTHQAKKKTYRGVRIEKLSSEEKVIHVLPQIRKRNFGEHNAPAMEAVLDLLELRNRITHPKPASADTMFDYLYRRALDYDYGRAFEAVKDFINFYEGNSLIEDCPCKECE